MTLLFPVRLLLTGCAYIWIKLKKAAVPALFLISLLPLGIKSGWIKIPVLLKTNKGALIVEYTLLLVSCIAMAMLFNKIVDMDSGWVIRKWLEIIEVIANDI